MSLGLEEILPTRFTGGHSRGGGMGLVSVGQLCESPWPQWVVKVLRASTLAVCMDSGCGLGDFVSDSVQINFPLCVVKIIDELGDASVI